MWIGIIGLDDMSYLRVLKHSHNKSQREEVLTRSHKKKTKQRKSTEKITVIEYSRYQYIIEHPQLGHGGYGSTKSNNKRSIRMHAFHGFPKEAQEGTFLVDCDLFVRKDQFAAAKDSKK